MNYNDFMIADTHFGHKAIVKYEFRPFKSVEEMDKTLIENWNATVSKNDRVRVLGDFSFYNAEKTKEIVGKLNGYKILIKGNHDRKKSNKWWYDVGFDEVYEYPYIWDKEKLIFSHEPISIGGYLNIHGHLHGGEHRGESGMYQICVSLEQIDYKPQRLINIINNSNYEY